MDSKRLLELPPEAAARFLTLAVLDEAVAAARRLKAEDDADAEALHDFRVALRRCRTLLKAYRSLLKKSVSKKQKRQLKDLAAGTGGARDSEVQLEWLRPQEQNLKPVDRHAWLWLVQRLEDRRQSAYGSVRQQLVQRFNDLEPRLRRRLARYVASVELGERARTFAPTIGELVRKAGDELASELDGVRGPSDVEAAHQARIRAKRLRYLLEPLRQTEVGQEAVSLVKTLKGLQELLGELHDAHVLAAEIASSLVDSATERVRRLHDALYAHGSGDPKPLPRQRDLRAGLLAVDRLIRDRVRALFETLETKWLGEPIQSFQASLASFADALAAFQGGHLEIERKYLLQALPSLGAEVVSTEINQGWIPGDHIRERLRRVESESGPRFFRTVKTGKGIQRIELEDKMEPKVFEQLWPLTEGHRVHKRRYRVPEGNLVWEIDQFLDRDLVVAEVELQASDAQVEMPAWLMPHLVREVTGEPDYLNENLGR